MIEGDLGLLSDYISISCQHANVVIDAAVAPSCTTIGYTEGSHCGDCGQTLVVQQPYIVNLEGKYISILGDSMASLGRPWSRRKGQRPPASWGAG